MVFVALYSELLIFGLNLVWGVAENNNTVSKYILFFSQVLILMFRSLSHIRNLCKATTNAPRASDLVFPPDWTQELIKATAWPSKR